MTDSMEEMARGIALKEHPVCEKYPEDCDIYNAVLKALHEVRERTIEDFQELFDKALWYDKEVNGWAVRNWPALSKYCEAIRKLGEK